MASNRPWGENGGERPWPRYVRMIRVGGGEPMLLPDGALIGAANVREATYVVGSRVAELSLTIQELIDLADNDKDPIVKHAVEVLANGYERR